jgi:hypothetical protein
MLPLAHMPNTRNKNILMEAYAHIRQSVLKFY